MDRELSGELFYILNVFFFPLNIFLSLARSGFLVWSLV